MAGSRTPFLGGMPMPAKWLLLRCIGKCVFHHGSKGLLNYVGGKGLGDVLFDALPAVARDSHACLQENKDEPGQLAEVQEIAQASPAEVHQAATQVAEEVA